jgi:Lipopolysaccharide-assembly
VRAAALALAAGLLAGGCGYTVGGTLPSNIQTIAVPIFKNLTREPAVESLITRAVVEAISTNGRLRLARSGEADAILEGDITGYGIASIAFDQNANVRLYRLTVTVNLRLRDLKQNKLLFQQNQVQEQSDFRVQGQVSQTISSEETALRTAATDIGRSIVALVVTRF